MTYRVYVRWKRQRVTENRGVAELAYEPLIHRHDLVNTSAGVAFTEDGKQLRFHPFGESSRTLGTVTMPGANDL